MSVHKSYAVGIKKFHSTSIFHLASLYRYYNVHKSTIALPTYGDYSVHVGCPKLVANNSLKKLNMPLSTAGYIEEVDSLKVVVVKK